ncbi:hypothetical protein GQ44DRAFT_720539 [Phaeosphaeriaceae sp. PMI808]|nr:hypothetical protein GQ44DRAFT_720539 [Phaeosphaeriaceae sp. PMI808]
MALDIWGRLTNFCTFKAEEPPQEVKSKTDRLSKELAEESNTFDRVVSTFKQTDDSDMPTLCVDPDLSTDIMDSTLRMFDITSDLITANLEMLNHFRKVSETFYHSRNAGGIAFGMWYLGGATVKSSAVIIPGVGCGVGIVAAGYNHWKASNAEKERKRLQNVTECVHGIYVCCQKIATTLLPVTEIELCNEDEVPWTGVEPPNDDGNARPNTSIKRMREFYVDIHSRKKVVLIGTHYETFRTVFLEEDKQIMKSVNKIADVDPTFAELRK